MSTVIPFALNAGLAASRLDVSSMYSGITTNTKKEINSLERRANCKNCNSLSTYEIFIKLH